MFFKYFVPTYQFIKILLYQCISPIPSHQCEHNILKLPDVIRYSNKILCYWKEIAVLLGAKDKIAATDIKDHTIGLE